MRYRIIALSHLQRQPFNKVCNERKSALSRDKIAVIIPCYNEALTIGKVIDGFRRELPEASVYVYDNNSTDGTAAIARSRGAVVRLEPRQGKGNVCRQMFRDIDADCYLMVDGDDTYPAESAWALCAPVLAGEADMVVGDRLSNGTYAKQNGRTFHGFGNDLVRAMIKWIYGYGFEDVMTGYRAMSRPFVKTFPVLSEGFQIETELSIHAVDRRWRIVNIPVKYRDRPNGSVSKLNTVRDPPLQHPRRRHTGLSPHSPFQSSSERHFPLRSPEPRPLRFSSFFPSCFPPIFK